MILMLVFFGLMAALPVYAGDNVKCSDLGSYQELKIESEDMALGTFSNDDGFELTVNSFSVQHVDWTSNSEVFAVVWKSFDSIVTVYDSPVLSDITTGDGKHAMSHLSVCYKQRPTAAGLLSFEVGSFDFWGWLKRKM